MRSMRAQDNKLLETRMGSYAFGLDHADSDIDMYGIFVAPNRDFLGLDGPSEKKWTDHNAGPDQDDHTFHELGKFARLLIDGDPMAIEFMFADHEFVTYEGEMFVAGRDLFLSQKLRNKFVGFARSNMKKLTLMAPGSAYDLMSSDDVEKRRKKVAKHQRHTFRLLFEAQELLLTGKLTLKSPAKTGTLLYLGDIPVDEALSSLESMISLIEAIDSSLPEKPNKEAANDLILQIRGV